MHWQCSDLGRESRDYLGLTSDLAMAGGVVWTLAERREHLAEGEDKTLYRVYDFVF